MPGKPLGQEQVPSRPVDAPRRNVAEPSQSTQNGIAAQEGTRLGKALPLAKMTQK